MTNKSINKLSIAGLLLGLTKIYPGYETWQFVPWPVIGWEPIRSMLAQDGVAFEKVGICPDKSNPENYLIFYVKPDQDQKTYVTLPMQTSKNTKREDEKELCTLMSVLRRAMSAEDSQIQLGVEVTDQVLNGLRATIRQPKIKVGLEFGMWTSTPGLTLIDKNMNEVVLGLYGNGFLDTGSPTTLFLQIPVDSAKLAQVNGNMLIYVDADSESNEHRCIVQVKGISDEMLRILENPQLNPEDWVDFSVIGKFHSHLLVQGHWWAMDSHAPKISTLHISAAATLLDFTEESMKDLDKPFNDREFDAYLSKRNALFLLCYINNMKPSEIFKTPLPYAEPTPLDPSKITEGCEYISRKAGVNIETMIEVIKILSWAKAILPEEDVKEFACTLYNLVRSIQQSKDQTSDVSEDAVMQEAILINAGINPAEVMQGRLILTEAKELFGLIKSFYLGLYEIIGKTYKAWQVDDSVPLEFVCYLADKLAYNMLTASKATDSKGNVTVYTVCNLQFQPFSFSNIYKVHEKIVGNQGEIPDEEFANIKRRLDTLFDLYSDETGNWLMDLSMLMPNLRHELRGLRFGIPTIHLIAKSPEGEWDFPEADYIVFRP